MHTTYSSHNILKISSVFLVILLFLWISITFDLFTIRSYGVQQAVQKIKKTFIPELDTERIEDVRPRDIVLKPYNVTCKNLKFLIVIQVAATDIKSRDWYRKTIGNNKTEYSYDFFFSIGKAKSISSNHDIMLENNKHGDMLQTEFLDSYHNLTLKQLSHMRYIKSSCQNIGIVLKIDDDVVFSLKRVSKFIDSIITLKKLNLNFWYKTKSRSEIFCHVFHKSPVSHSASGKWSVSRRFNQTYWPDFCSGSAYFISTKAINDILDNVEKFKYLWLDDVFLTGFVARKAGVELVDIKSRCYLNPWYPSFLRTGKYLLSMVSKNKIDEFYKAINFEL